MVNLRSPLVNVWKPCELFFPVGQVVEGGFRTRICLCRSRTLVEKPLAGERGQRVTSFEGNGNLESCHIGDGLLRAKIFSVPKRTLRK